ncbi:MULTISPECIES: hypothetical protein [Shouchella]|uniref:Uncharacterized protein n=2 Tax=Shouchella TaxID=2893057 RepID=A0ABY7W2N2_9BACI|nr:MULTISPECIES: hypothetical protein [Shouchella]MED4129926.1 hypothetical protein [Shouchella miscanthi]WDF03188.1 hypothetical protein PQ477_17085 [Shouchella hunanensis]GAF21335.1 hypothetical protein JCM19047_1013 [Bacillus sp. JCM 19047]
MNLAVYALSLFVSILVGLTSVFGAVFSLLSGLGSAYFLSWLGVAAFSFLVIYVIELSARVAAIEARLEEEEEE